MNQLHQDVAADATQSTGVDSRPSRHREDLLANATPILVLAVAAILFLVASMTSSDMLSIYLHGGAAATLACGIALYAVSRLKRAGMLRCSAFS